MINRFSLEFFLLFFNRLSNPLMAFVALAVFSRVFDQAEVSSYLLAYTATQWAITCAFQWQKNTYVKTYGQVGEGASALIFFISLLSFIPVFLFLTRGYGNWYSISMTLMCCATGFAFYLGIASRMRGGLSVYLIWDTFFNYLKWTFAILLCIYISNLDFLFFAQFIILVILIFIYALWFLNYSKIKVWRELANKAGFMDVKKIFYFSIFFIIIDFSSGGINYIDRFYIAESYKDMYLINAAIGSQVSAVFFGALVSAVNPKLKSIKQDERAKFYMKTEYRMLLIFFCVLLAAATLGPLAVELIGGVNGDRGLVVMFALSQFLHFYIILCFYFLFHFFNDNSIALLYLISFFILVAFILLLQPQGLYVMLVIKIALLFFLCVYSRYVLLGRLND